MKMPSSLLVRPAFVCFAFACSSLSQAQTAPATPPEATPPAAPTTTSDAAPATPPPPPPTPQAPAPDSAIPVENAPAEQPAAKIPVETAPAEDDVIIMSPFEVTANKDDSYQAMDSLAGARIRTDLRNVGSSISVANEKLMSDVGATSSETLLQYMGNAEVGGAKGNFLVGSSVGDAGVIDETASLLKPQGNTRVRGLTAADNARDYFATDIPWDGFNTSRVDLQRGANSILFGQGSGGGISNASPDPARFGKDTSVLDFRNSSFGSYRRSMNLNRELLRKELAIRFAAVDDKKYYQQKPAFNHDRRYYGALRYEPRFLRFDGARTTLKLNYENGRINANRPRLTTINDAISPWFIKDPIELRSPTPLNRAYRSDLTPEQNADRQTLLGVMYPMIWHGGYDPFLTGNTSLIASNPTRRDIGARAAYNSSSNRNAEGWLGALVKPTDQGGSQLNPSIDGNGLPFWMAVYDDPASSALSRYLYPDLSRQYYSVNSSGVRDGSAITGMRTPDYTGLLRLDQYASRGVGSFQYALQGVWRSRTITDPSVFDFYNKLIDGPNKAERSKFDVFNATLEQSFFHDRLGFQVSYDQQAYADYRQGNLANPTLRIDVYKYLPAALVNPSTNVMEPVLNPNFGRPYVISKPSASRSRNKRDVFRLTPYADIDFSEYFKARSLAARLLGRHTITGLYERSKFSRTASSWVPYAVSAAQADAIFGNGGAINAALRSIGTVTYLGPSLANADTLSGANLSAITAWQQPGTIGSDAWYFDSHYTSATSPGSPFTPPPNGLGVNQVGGNPTTQNENPLNYAGWGAGPRSIDVDNAGTAGERYMTTSYTRLKNVTTSQAIVDQWSLFDRKVYITVGMRKDKIETFYPGHPDVSATDPTRTGNRVLDNNTGVVDWNIPFTYTSAPSATFTSDWMKTYGIVVHAPNYISRRMPWGLQPSVYYNHSENFQPVTRNSPITGTALTPPMGKTREIGFSLASPNRKFSARVNWYETAVKNATMPDNGVINFTADEIVQGIKFSKVVQYSQDVNNGTNLSGGNPNGTINNPGSSGVSGTFLYRPTAQTSSSSTNLDPSGTHWYPWQPSRAPTTAQPWTLQEWRDAEAHAIASANAFLESLNTEKVRQFMAVWQINPNAWNYQTSNFNITSVTPQNLAVTGDTLSRGLEMELFFSPLNNWDVTLNAAKTYATRRNLAGDMGDWLQTRWALYNETYPGADGGGNGLLAGGVRWFSGGQGSTNAANARFGRNGYRFYSEFYSREGNNVPELRPWRFNGVTSYKFTQGALKGAFVGLSYRWEDRSVVGYGVTETDAELVDANGNSVRAAIGKLDVNKPYYGPTESHFGAWVGYSKKIYRNVQWRIQVNVNNLGEKNHLVPLTVNPDGSGAAYRIASGATWEMKNTFSF